MDLAAAIARIPDGEPHWLLPADEAAARAAWKALSLRFHPDRAGPGSEAVQAKVAALRSARRAALASGSWRGAATRDFRTADGRTLRLRWSLSEPCEVGAIMTGPTRTFLLFDSPARDWAARAERNLRAILSLHRDDRVRRQYAPILPALERSEALEDGRTLLVLSRPGDMVPLSWVMGMARVLGEPVGAAHLAWVLSSLLDFACWSEASGLLFNAPDPANVQVSLARHVAVPWGGWHFAARAGERVSALAGLGVEAARTVGGGGPVEASPALLGEGLRLLVRRLAAEVGADLPAPWRAWLDSTPVGRTAWQDYAAWEKARELSFGPRAWRAFPFGPQRALEGLPALPTDGSEPPAPRAGVDVPRRGAAGTA